MRNARVGLGSAVMMSSLAIAVAPAAAEQEDPRVDRLAARDTMKLVTAALALQEPEVVVVMMDGAVRFDLAADACGKAYRKPGTATGKTRLALARCLVQLAGFSSSPGPIAADDGRLRVDTVVGAARYVFELRRIKGRLRIVAVTHTEAPPEGTGEDSGELGGIDDEDPYPPPPPPPPPPVNITPQGLEAQRVAGEKYILPDDDTKREIAASGHTAFVVPVKVCVNTSGVVTDVRILKTSGYRAYDEKLNREIRRWRYIPFTVNGKPAPACGMVNFAYRQEASTPVTAPRP